MTTEPAPLFAPFPGAQTFFMARPETIAGFGGSAGPGKTACLLAHPLYTLESENQRWKRGEIARSQAWTIYFRRLIPTLLQSVERAMLLYRQVDPGVEYNSTEHTFRFPCGMICQFGGMEKPKDYLKYYSAEFSGIYFDELTEFTEEQWDQMFTRCRSGDPVLHEARVMRWGSNPVGEGLRWVRKRFVEIAEPKTTVRIRIQTSTGPQEIDQIYVPARLSDNPVLYADGRYEAALRISKPHIYRALLDGDWYVSEDALLGEIWNTELHVCSNHKPPRGAFRFRSCDFGIFAHSSVTWWYVDFDGAMTAYHHLYVKNQHAGKLAGLIREIEMSNGDWDEDERCSMLTGPLDAQCFKRSGTSGPTIAQEMAVLGVRWRPSVKDRVNGVAEVVRRLDTYATYEQNGIKKRKPMIRWMKKCKIPIEILPTLSRDPNNPEDLRDSQEDHCFDDTMFACQSKPLRPQPDADTTDNDEFEDELAELRSRRHRTLGLAEGNW